LYSALASDFGDPGTDGPGSVVPGTDGPESISPGSDGLGTDGPVSVM